MSRDDIVAKVQAKIWQTLASRGGIQSLPSNELAILIEAITTGIAVAVEGVGAPAVAPPAPIPPAIHTTTSEEVLLWTGQPHMTAGTDALRTRYELTSQRIRVISGMVGHKTDEADLIGVKDLRVEQSLTDRGLGIGNVIVTTTDPNQPTIVLRKIANPGEVKERIRRAMLDEKARRGVDYREMV
jgi:hypothetical protein